MEIKPPAALSLQRKFDFLIELILIFVLILSPLFFGSVNLFPTTIIELSAFLILFLWFIKAVIKGYIEFIKIPINKPIVLFLVFILIQYIFINFFVPDFAPGGIYGQKIKKEIFKLVSYLIFFYTILNNFNERKKITRLVYILISIGFSLAFLGIVQKLGNAKTLLWVSSIPNSSGAFASFPNRNHFANYINMIIFFALGGLFSQFPFLRNYLKDFKKESIFKWIFVMLQKGILLYVFGLIIMSSSIFFSFSRGGMIGFFCGLLLFSTLILLKGLTKRGYLFMLIILAATLAMLMWVKA
ncbi:MAG: hypothetical protein PHG69_01100, partial [Candidatus Omnitrophica bacterium]|nr:hypothetical protein [Candidatus Omnitrophota bacterium]